MKVRRVVRMLAMFTISGIMTGSTFSEPPISVTPKLSVAPPLMQFSSAKRETHHLKDGSIDGAQQVYPILNKEQIGRIFSENEINEISAFASNAIGDNGLTTGQADPVLMKTLGKVMMYGQNTAPSVPLALSQR